MAWCENIHLAWNQFHLDVPQWEFGDHGITCIFGESGSGKTTLLQVIAGLLACPGFKMSLNGELITEQPPRARNIAFVFQDYGLFGHMTAFENIAFGAESKEIPQMMWIGHAEKLIARLGLERVRHQKAATLSGGEQQRVALARALVTKPRLICLDEPLSALDEKMRDEARALISELSEDFKVPFILVTHDLRDVRGLSTSLLLLSRGQVIASGATAALLIRPPTLAAAQVIPENQVIRLAALTEASPQATNTLAKVARAPHEGIAHVVAKPWTFEVLEASSKTKDLTATVMHTFNEGPRWRVYVKLPNGQLITAWSPLDIKPGQVIDLKIDVNSLMLFGEA